MKIFILKIKSSCKLINNFIYLVEGLASYLAATKFQILTPI